MKTIKFTAISLLAVILLIVLPKNSAHALIGDRPDGTYTQDFSGSVIPLLDLTGTYTQDMGFGFMTDFMLLQDAPGTLHSNFFVSGSFTVTGTFNNTGLTWPGGSTGISLSGISVVTGMVSGAGNVRRASMRIILTGTGIEDIHLVTVSESVKLSADLTGSNTLHINQANTIISKIDHHTGIIKRFVSQTNMVDSDIDLVPNAISPDMPGDWHLIIDLHPQPRGDNYTGTATIHGSNGATSNFIVAGSFDKNMHVTNLILKGAGGLQLTIRTSGASMTVLSLKGTVFGQSLNYTAP